MSLSVPWLLCELTLLLSCPPYSLLLSQYPVCTSAPNHGPDHSPTVCPTMPTLVWSQPSPAPPPAFFLLDRALGRSHEAVSFWGDVNPYNYLPFLPTLFSCWQVPGDLSQTSEDQSLSDFEM